MTTFPTHPAFETYRRECADAQAEGHGWGTQIMLANDAVEHEHGFRFETEHARYAITTAPEIASEPGRMGDALRLIATAFDALPAGSVEPIPAPRYAPLHEQPCACSELDPRALQGGAVCDPCHERNERDMIAAEQRSERLYASSYGLGL